ncbi:MAG: hypothetical protein HY716_12040 [Planctomycetes bacterium]|nr:hypothetical protein [Planctomycetota bacterium]
MTCNPSSGRAGAFLLVLIAAGIAAFLAFRGFTSSSGPPRVDYLDPDVAEFHTLGFLGAAGHGATRSIKVPDATDPQQFRYPGGVVLRTIEDGSPLRAIGLRVGDVLIRVEKDFLPLKEDPTLDLLRRLEAALSAGLETVELAFLRDGRIQTARLALTLPPLEQGLPGRSARYELAAEKGLEFLKGSQLPDGSFPAARDEAGPKAAVTAMVGLAFLASGSDGKAGTYAESVGRCGRYLEGALKSATAIGPWATAATTLFFAERYARAPEPSVFALIQEGVRLLIASHEEGGWSAGQDLGYCERTLTANQCLTALGAAERVGVEIENQVFERACAYLKKHSNDGTAGFVVDPTFDSRREAGRCAGALVALRSMGCRMEDAFLQNLTAYYSEHVRSVAQAAVALPTHFLSAAIWSRQVGLSAWTNFNEHHQVFILSQQELKGSFAAPPRRAAPRFAGYEACDGPSWRTAHYALICLLQNDSLVWVKAEAAGKRTRDGNGVLVDDVSKPAEDPKLNRTFNSIDEAIEFLKKMGVGQDDPNMKQLENLRKGSEEKKKEED